MKIDLKKKKEIINNSVDIVIKVSLRLLNLLWKYTKSEAAPFGNIWFELLVWN